MKVLHPFQIMLLELLRQVPEDGFSLGQLRDEIGASSKSQVVHHIAQLEQKGLIKRNPDNPSDFIVFGAEESEESFTFLPLLALAACGSGIDNTQHVIERIPVKSSLIPSKISNTFLVKADGHSMEPRIHSGDIVAVEKFRIGSPEPIGKVVVCEDGQGVKIKQYTRANNGQIMLISFNKDEKYKPHLIDIDDEDSFTVHGIVRSILFSKSKF